MKNTRRLERALIGAALFAAATAAQAISFNVSNSQSGWLASVQAIGPTTVGSGNFVGVGCQPGQSCPNVATNGVPGVSIAQNGSGSASFDNGLLNNLGGGFLQWTFTTPQNGWGGTFQMALNNGIAFQVLDLPEGSSNLGWVDVTTVGAGQALNGFLGFSSTERFGGVRVSAVAGSTASSYRMTDFSVARASVPEPGSLALLALGGLAVGFFRRQRKA